MFPVEWCYTNDFVCKCWFMNFGNRNTIKLLMITYFNGALVTNGQTRKQWLFMLRSTENAWSILSMLIMSLVGHNFVSVRNKISFFIWRESEAISLTWLFNDLVLINVKKRIITRSNYWRWNKGSCITRSIMLSRCFCTNFYGFLAEYASQKRVLQVSNSAQSNIHLSWFEDLLFF